MQDGHGHGVKKVTDGSVAQANRAEEVENVAAPVAAQPIQSELTEEDPAHHDGELVFDKFAISLLLASTEFEIGLNTVCRAVFRDFGPSPRYPEWQDLRQEVLTNFIPWLHNYKETATLKTVLNRIAINLCIDESRRQKAQRRAHVEVDFDELDIETLRIPFAHDPDVRVLVQECRSQLTEQERAILDEYYIEGWTLTEIARRHLFSPQTAVNKMAVIMKKLQRFVAGRNNSGA